MLADVLPYLHCPICRQPLAAAPQPGLRCPAGHSFDLARQGYVNLLTGQPGHPGDTPAMIAARAAFLGTGGYDFIATAAAPLAAPSVTRAELPATPAAAGRGGLVVDVGAGTGYHLARLLDVLPDAVGLAVDAAKPAVRRAARAHPRIGAVLADVWRALPLADGSVSVLLNVFAPRNPAEFARVLAADGVLLVVTPTTGHLAELADQLGATGQPAAGPAATAGTGRVRLLRIDPDKPARVTATLAGHFQLTDERLLTRSLRLTRAQVRDLVLMGPSAAHTDPAALERAVAALPEPVDVTASVRLASYRRPPQRRGPAQVERSTSSQPRGGPW